jgi:hypothetical protein
MARGKADMFGSGGGQEEEVIPYQQLFRMAGY